MITQWKDSHVPDNSQVTGTKRLIALEDLGNGRCKLCTQIGMGCDSKWPKWRHGLCCMCAVFFIGELNLHFRVHLYRSYTLDVVDRLIFSTTTITYQKPHYLKTQILPILSYFAINKSLEQANESWLKWWLWIRSWPTNCMSLIVSVPFNITHFIIKLI